MEEIEIGLGLVGPPLTTLYWFVTIRREPQT